GEWTLDGGAAAPPPEATGKRRFVVAYDFGIKRNILRHLVAVGCRVRVVPAGFPAADVLKMRPDGVFLSNGPGDPAAVPYAVDNVRFLIGKVPIFGICLGHQILSRAMGAETFKLRFGHHGGNQPVMDQATRKVEITSQNHGFAVEDGSKGDFDVISLNLNDRTIEGLRHRTLPIFSVQYHPEASPGPHDSSHLFNEFTRMMESR
ncbi:MAG: carbamoyl phosphate synthase small subunit, partial [Nitrospinaceae bacterium]